jgi:hypothetical protein
VADPTGQALEIRAPDEPPELNGTPLKPKEAAKFTDVELAAAQLYGRGYSRRQIMRILMTHLAPNGQNQDRKYREKVARSKLRRMEEKQGFRDLVWNHAVVGLDLMAPQILQGIAGKARRGRVDAARLALEVTGRHNPRGDDQPTHITVAIANVPRPD